MVKSYSRKYQIPLILTDTVAFRYVFSEKNERLIYGSWKKIVAVIRVFEKKSGL